MPLFFVVKGFGMVSTYQGLILVYIAYSLPFTVFFMHAFFRTLPGEVAVAPFIDGCSHAGVFFRVMLPMARAGEIRDFTGVGQPYEEPESPDLEVPFGEPLEDAAERVLAALRS
mgnify:CR=1 FL=1